MSRQSLRASKPTQRRCAIYTRKSSEEGLEQEFNSLDAQRVACEAYVQSQIHEGWKVLPDVYDDGGISGGTMERPALQRLLADVQSGQIDIVVVYKVDRLTRSLSDFAKIVDVFDAKEVSFVSVTQAFNTTNSMGRLTLNVLLSFAQFEREVTGERIRDKIAASKKKGMWMGGLPSLGYDVRDKKLVINDVEAQTVRHIYQRYLELGSVASLQAELNQHGVTSKQRTDRHGNQTGGHPLTRGALYLMLQNKVYIGEIIHKDQSYPGQHEGIIDDDLWRAVQAQLQDNQVERKVQSNATDPSLLAGLLYNEQGEPLSPSHANKKGVRYRYYVSQSLIKQTVATASGNNTWRLPANQIETLVQERIIAFLNNAQAIHHAAEAQDIHDISTRHSLAQHAAVLATDWSQKNTARKRELVLEIIEKVSILKDEVHIDLCSGKLLAVLGHSCEETSPRSGELITLSVKATLKRTGMQMRLIVEGQAPKAEPDKALIRLMALAHRYNTLLQTNEGANISAVAKEAGVSSSYFTRILRLSYLSPQIKKLILQGRQPYHLTAKSLVNNTNLPLLWSEQEQILEV